MRNKTSVICILITLLLGYSVCLAAELKDSNVISLMPKWKKGEKHTYEIVKTREQNKSPEKSTSRTSAEIQVLKANKSGCTLMWSWGKVTLDDVEQNSDSIVQKLANLQQGLSIKLKIDQLARIEEVENWEEIRDYIFKVIDTIREESRSSGIDTNALLQTTSQMRSMFSDKEQIEAFCIRDIQLFMAAIGREYDSSRPFEYDDKIADPFGGEPLPTKGKFSLKSNDKSTDFVIVLWEQTFDPNKALKAVSDGLEKIAPDPEEAHKEMHSQLKNFSIEDRGEFTIERSSGWIERAFYVRTVKAGNIFRKDSTTMTRKDDRTE